MSSSSSSLSPSLLISWAAHHDDTPRHANQPRTFQVEIEDICADKLDDAICLRDALFDDDDATEEVDKGVFKETFAGEFDAVSAMGRLCKGSGVDVEFV